MFFYCFVLRRHEINNLPDSEEDLGVWLRDLFKEKVCIFSVMIHL